MQFLNISNHPSSSWSPAQVEAAKSLGGNTIVDVKFSHVDPQWSTEEVESEAIKIVSALDLNDVNAAMVAGEPLLAAFIIKQLQNRGIVSYSATTERVVEERDGVKTSRFTFVRFREWPTL